MPALRLDAKKADMPIGEQSGVSSVAGAIAAASTSASITTIIVKSYQAC